MAKITIERLKNIRAEAETLTTMLHKVFMDSPEASLTESFLSLALDGVRISREAIEDAIGALQDTRHKTTVPEQRVALLAHAIAFQRQVKLGYGNDVRTIEPSLIKETRGGHTLLYALKVEPGRAPSLRSYRLDRVTSVEVTNAPFTAPDPE